MPLGSKPFREWSSRTRYDAYYEQLVSSYNGICFCTFPLSNFEVYEGFWKDGKRDGYGVQRYGVGTSSVSSFSGEWQENLRHGRGIMTYASGNKYDGYWVKVSQCVDGCRGIFQVMIARTAQRHASLQEIAETPPSSSCSRYFCLLTRLTTRIGVGLLFS